MPVGCYVLLEINDGFFFDRALSRAVVNKFKGQQGYTSFLAGNTANRAGDTVFRGGFRGGGGGGAEGAAAPSFSSSEIYFFVKIYNNFIIL